MEWMTRTISVLLLVLSCRGVDKGPTTTQESAPQPSRAPAVAPAPKPAIAPATEPEPEPAQAPAARILWVGTPCARGQDCVGRTVTVAGEGARSVTAVTGQTGVARFALDRPEGAMVRVTYEEAPGLAFPRGKGVEPVELKLGPTGELVAVAVQLVDLPNVTEVAEASGPRTAAGGSNASGAWIPPKAAEAAKAESLASIDGLQKSAYSGTLKAKGFRDVVVYTSFPGSYLYLENKRIGTVPANGFVIEKMPLGTHRFVAKMPQNAEEYLPPVSDVREVVKGKGAQVVRLAFAKNLDPMARMLKRVEEGETLSEAELGELRRVRPDDANYGDALSVLVSYYEKKRRYGEALRALSDMAGTSRYASDPEVHFHLAKLKTATGDYDGALGSLVDMQRYMNQYRASDRNRKMAEMFRLRAQVNGLLYARSRGTKPAFLEASTRDWTSFMGLTGSEAEKRKAAEEIEKNQARLKRIGD